MAKRKKSKKTLRRVLAAVLILILVMGLTVGLFATRAYMRLTGADFPTALRDTAKLGFGYIANVLSPRGDAVAPNPYHSDDYYFRGGLLQCTASEVSRAGIDVSLHQQEIDWQAVADAGIDFAIIRAGYRGYTEGEVFVDSRAVENLEGALAAGLDVGIYFFSQATSESEAREEADLVLDLIDGYDIRYPVFYDWEGIVSDARTDDISGEEMTAFAHAFCERIESAGYTAGVYFNQSYGLRRFDLRALRDYEFWLAEYHDTQSFPYEVQLWQYNCEATLPGIETTVDLNLCYRHYPIETEEFSDAE